MDEMNNNVQSENNFNAMNDSMNNNFANNNEQVQVSAPVENSQSGSETISENTVNTVNNGMDSNFANNNEQVQVSAPVANNQLVSETISENTVNNDFNNGVINSSQNFVNNGMNTNNNFSSGSAESKKKKNSTLFIVIGLIAAVIVLAVSIVFFGYKSFVNKPINLYKGVINILYKEFSDTLNSTETFNINKNSLVVNGDLKLNSTMQELKDYTNYTYDFGFGIDVKNKKMELSVE